MFSLFTVCFQRSCGLNLSNGVVAGDLRRNLHKKTINFYLVNSDFSLDFLKLTHINPRPNDRKQKSIVEILNSIRSSFL